MVTPAMARQWLERNEGNRRLRPGIVESFAHAFARGEWKITHQGVGFAQSGRLLDGQHRLTFISQLPEGVSVPINVTTGMDEDVFGAIDQGARRTLSDVLSVSGDMAACGMFFAKIVDTRRIGITVQQAVPFVEFVSPEYEQLVSYCSAKARIFSSAAVRCAAIYQMKRGHDADFIKLAYWSLVHADIDSMPPAARVLMSQHISGKIVSARSADLFCRALRVFDSRSTGKVSRIIIKDQAGILAEVREYVIAKTKKGPASAGPKVAKPEADFKRAKIAAVA